MLVNLCYLLLFSPKCYKMVGMAGNHQPGILWLAGEEKLSTIFPARNPVSENLGLEWKVGPRPLTLIILKSASYRVRTGTVSCLPAWVEKSQKLD